MSSSLSSLSLSVGLSVTPIGQLGLVTFIQSRPFISNPIMYTPFNYRYGFLAIHFSTFSTLENYIDLQGWERNPMDTNLMASNDVSTPKTPSKQNALRDKLLKREALRKIKKGHKEWWCSDIQKKVSDIQSLIHLFIFSTFLLIDTQLYMRLCLLVSPSVAQSVIQSSPLVTDPLNIVPPRHLIFFFS